MNVLLKKEPVNRVNVALKKFNESFNIIVLNTTAKTAENAANSLKCDLGAIVKSLVFRAENEFLICLIAGDKRCSLNKLKKILKKKDVSMANAEQVKSQTGFSIGGVSPVAHLEKIEILIDSSLSKYENVYAAAGHPNTIFKITYKQLIKLTDGKEKDIV